MATARERRRRKKNPPLTYDPRNPAQQAQRDVDQHIRAAPTLHHHRDRRDEDGEEVEQNIGLPP
jgi:hypothetical protein